MPLTHFNSSSLDRCCHPRLSQPRFSRVRKDPKWYVCSCLRPCMLTIDSGRFKDSQIRQRLFTQNNHLPLFKFYSSSCSSSLLSLPPPLLLLRSPHPSLTVAPVPVPLARHSAASQLRPLPAYLLLQLAGSLLGDITNLIGFQCTSILGGTW